MHGLQNYKPYIIDDLKKIYIYYINSLTPSLTYTKRCNEKVIDDILCLYIWLHTILVYIVHVFEPWTFFNDTEYLEKNHAFL